VIFVVFVIADKKIDNQRQNEIQQQCFSKQQQYVFYYLFNSFLHFTIYLKHHIFIYRSLHNTHCSLSFTKKYNLKNPCVSRVKN